MKRHLLPNHGLTSDIVEIAFERKHVSGRTYLGLYLEIHMRKHEKRYSVGLYIKAGATKPHDPADLPVDPDQQTPVIPPLNPTPLVR